MTIYSELSFENDVKTIVGVQFSILDAAAIERMSVCEITSTDTYSGSEPIIGGLFDSRMGVIENDKICKVCMQKNAFCPGHFGHIKLAKPVFHSQFFETVRKILRCVCYRCSALLIDPEDPEICKIINKKINRQKKFDLIYKLSSGKFKTCGSSNTLNGCGAKQPHKVQKENIGRIIMSWNDKDIVNTEENEKEKKVEFLAEDVLNILKRVSDQDGRILGFSPEITRLESLICTVFPVPPPSVRPSVKNDTGQRCEDDLTHKLCDIVKTNNTLKQKIASGSTKETIDTWVKLVQYHVSTFVDNQLPGVAPAKQRTGRPLRSVTERLKSKEGRIRGNLMGKRVDFSARSVITPDPNISIDEVGVPMKIAMNLTFPETVNKFNFDKLKKLIANGPDAYPGAKYIKKFPDYRTVRINARNSQEIQNIQDGDIVERHLLDGDYVLFNRQPSLHKMSMMSHRVRVMQGDTFRLNVCCTPSYNADYDGDEMNMHVPQSAQTENELRQLASVPTQIISPKDSSPIISIVQDITLGVYKLTHDDTFLTQKQTMNILSNNSKFNGKLPDDTHSKGQMNMISGKDILSTIIPPTVSTEVKSGDLKTARIINGRITKDSGQLNKDTFQKMSTGIVHSVFNDIGAEETTALFDNTQRLICDFLVYNGFSVGVSDLMLCDKTKKHIDECLKQMIEKTNDYSKTVENNQIENKTMLTNEQRFESHISSITSNTNNSIQKAVLDDPSIKSSDNRMLNMINSKSKGNIINVLQMMGVVGQCSVEGKRISYGFDDRTLPHFQKYDDSPEARGFVKHSFIDGLNPQEFFFHAMGGREGLIDTAVKTSETGYLQRKLVKAMEDAKIHYDMSVRNASGQIVSFMYGDDGMDSTKLEKQFIPFLRCDDVLDLKNMYLVDSYLKFKDYIVPSVLTAAAKNNKQPMLDYRRDMNKKLFDYFSQVTKDRRFVIEKILGFSGASNISYPVAFKRLIESAATVHQLDDMKLKDLKVDLTPEYVFDQIEKLGKNMVHKFNKCNKVFKILLRAFLNPKDLIINRRFTKAAFDLLCENIHVQFQKAIADPSEMVGVVAAQSIGEPTTQLTLNTFHLSGVASASKAVRGVPRIKELLSISKNIKSPMLKIYLTGTNKMKENASNAQRRIQTLKLSRFIQSIVLRYEEELPPDWVEKADQYDLKGGRIESYNNSKSKWVLHIELDAAEMIFQHVSTEKISMILDGTYNDKVAHVHSNITIPSVPVIYKIKIIPDEGDDVISDLKAVEQDISNLVISGITGIHNVVVEEDVVQKKIDVLNEMVVEDADDSENLAPNMLITEGTNLRDVLGLHEFVDQKRTISNDIYEIYELLGIEAARQALFNEIYEIFGGNGNVNQRHVSLLVDTMTCKGQLLSIDRHGINRSDIGPLAKCSFEETADILIKSGIFGDHDKVQGVAANVIVGQVCKAGTGDSAILMDHELISKANLTSIHSYQTSADMRCETLQDILEEDPFEFSSEEGSDSDDDVAMGNLNWKQD